MKSIHPFIILIALALIACKAPEQITTTISKDSVIYREVPKYIEVPGKSVMAPSINLDSLVALVQEGVKPEVINRTLTYTDTTSNINLQLMIDAMGNLTAICQSRGQRIMYLEEQVEYYKSLATTEQVIKPKPFWEEVQDMGKVVLVTLLLTGLVVFIFKLFR